MGEESKSLWRYVHTSDMIVDVGTRKWMISIVINSGLTGMIGWDQINRRFQSHQSTMPQIWVSWRRNSKGDTSDYVWMDILENKVKAVSYYSNTISKHLEERQNFLSISLIQASSGFARLSAFRRRYLCFTA